MSVDTQELETELLDLERAGWESIAARNPEHYRALVVEETIIVDDEGVHKGSDLAEKVGEIPVRLGIKNIGDSKLIRLAPDNVVLTYRIEIEFEGGGGQALYASSVYARRAGAWRLVFHQQTSIPTPEPSKDA